MDPAISAADLNELRLAKALLENPSLAARISNTIGAPIERALARLPAPVSESIALATRKALQAGLRIAVASLDDASGPPRNGAHKWLVGASGAGGGALGLLGLPLELPMSTILMLRSVADIARSQGEDFTRPEAKLACLEVFALGGAEGDAAETGYFAVRAALARAIAEATEHLATRGLLEEAAPAVVRLIGRIAARFSIPVTQKVAAQMVPVIGAAAGASINLMFMDHYQDMARGHFTVRRLERRYGEALVRQAYGGL
jgi:hypothetical protein